MLKISILKVESPSCLWGCLIWSQEDDPKATEQHRMLAEMNLFYHDVKVDPHQLKPSTVEEGQVCVVYWPAKKSWCRAVVETVAMDWSSCRVCCLLVDHGERLVVSLNQIRLVAEKFLQLSSLVRRFHLARVQPLTLRVVICEEKAELVPSTHWDTSATLYLHRLLQDSTQTEAVLLESESDSTSIELYVTVERVKICVNDDLVARSFAYFTSKLQEDPRLHMSASVLTEAEPTASDEQTAGTQPPAVMSPDQVAAGAGDAAVARFLRFMNPGSRSLQAAPPVRQHEPSDREPEEVNAASNACTGQEAVTAVKRGAACFLEHSQVEHVADEERSCSSCSAESGSDETDKAWRHEGKPACSWLLEWLNPEPLNTDLDSAEDTNLPDDPRKSGILVHSALPVQPCTGLDDAPITDDLHRALRRHECSLLSPAERHSWPAVARGCNTAVISHTADRPLSYLPPLLTHILLNSIFSSVKTSTGPVAVLLCPGWEKAQVVCDLLEEYKVAKTLRPLIVLLGVGKDEAKSVKIPENCLLLVTTPFSLVRLLSCHCFSFLRMYHLVLDEADQLFSLAPDEMETVLQHFQKVTSRGENASCPQQVVAVARRWVRHMEGLLANHMPSPHVVMAVPEEAALYGNVQQIILMTLESSKTSVLLGALDLNPDVGQKTLIVADSAQEVEDVYKAVGNKSAFCLKTHEGLTQQFDFVVQQWKKDIGPGTQVILVTTSHCLQGLGIRDATCVIHFSFPTSPKQFGSRLFCMSENFRNFSERGRVENSPHLPKSVLLISERNVRHVAGVMRYLGRCDALLPPELSSFAQSIHVARDAQKTNRPLCRYLKSFGVCRDSSSCPDRHTFISQLDQSQLPSSGVIEVLPLHIRTASVFYGRIVRSDDGFGGLVADMTSYFHHNKPAAKDLQEGGFYAVQEGDAFHRVKILSLPDRQGRLFYSVLVRFIDVGLEEKVKSHQLLQLPEQFHRLPGQAVEIVVCRVKPVDAELDWHPKATRAIGQKIRGLQHRARAVLSLGNTVFVDPMVCVTPVPGLKTVINEHNVQSEILKTGLGVSNKEHVDLLRALCQDGQPSSGKAAGHCSGSGDGRLSLEGRIQAEEELLAESFRASQVHDVQAREPQSPAPLIHQALIPEPPAPGRHLGPVCVQNGSDLKSADHTAGDAAAVRPATNPTASRATCQNGSLTGESGRQKGVLSANGTDGGAKSFHPQVRWYQTSDSVIATVKLKNPERQGCDFYPDRVVYRGSVGGRSYRADLDLQGNVAVDRCSWEMKSNEPVLKLLKQKQGYWERLVRTKNIFVSYDLEHVEEDEAGASGQWFVEDTGEETWRLNSQSDTDSD